MVAGGDHAALPPVVEPGDEAILTLVLLVAPEQDLALPTEVDKLISLLTLGSAFSATELGTAVA